MDSDFDSQKDLIISKLNAKVSTLICPICQNNSFTLGGGYFAHDLQKNLKNRQLGGTNIPTVPIICKNCGFVAEFAAGTLGLLPNQAEKVTDKSKT